MSEIFTTTREEFGVRGSAPLWFERRLSFAMRRLFVHPIRYDPKRRKPPHSKYTHSMQKKERHPHDASLILFYHNDVINI